MAVQFPDKSIILIVDDSPTNLALLSKVLDDGGFEVWIARDGESAIQKVGYDQPDLILLDVMMPGVDGFETCYQLKSNPLTADIPVIFLTARTDAIDKVKGLNLGAVDYITKPLQPEEVLARVRIHLKLRFLTKTLEQQNQLLKTEVQERTAAELALQGLTQELEERVEQRTTELAQALSNLQQAQVQLVQSEKLAILGQLVAGVAHEINNPISCIFGNLDCAEAYIADLLGHLQVYKQYAGKITAVEDHAEAIDLAYLIEDLPQMMGSMKAGIERIRNISVSLRNFYRSDSSIKTLTDIHEGLDSTLLILQHRLKACGHRSAIQVVKEYGNIPPIKCYPSQLNQVFMNLLANAVDALEESAESGLAQNAPTIWIRTERLSEDWVAIYISDNGVGMTPEVSQRLFEPMFTTKPVGKGTGLGLSISRQIIEQKHGGRLTGASGLGKGAEFAIALPMS